MNPLVVVSSFLSALFCLTTISTAQIAEGGDSHSLILCNDKSVWATGLNNWGQGGDSTTTPRLTYVRMTAVSNAKAVSTGSWHSSVLLDDGTVWTCGYNNKSQLGNGTSCNCANPVPAPVVGPGGIGILDSIRAIAAGGRHNLVLHDDSTVWVWGLNSDGQLGDSTNIDKSTPVQIQQFSNIISISAGLFHSMALQNDEIGFEHLREHSNWIRTGVNLIIVVLSPS